MAEAEEEAEEPQAEINIENAEIINKKTPLAYLRQNKWWIIQTIIYSFFILAGESGGTLLGRSYFVNGGKSEWMATLVQVVGFPILIPFLWITATKNDQLTTTINTKKHLASFYIAIGILYSASCMLYSTGLKYLPVTTYTLVCATQLGFSALFSYFINKQKITPYIVNSIVLLTFSSTLLVFQIDPVDSRKSSRKNYVIGFLCTLTASSDHALTLSLTQVAFHRIIKKETIRGALELTIYQSLIATFAIVIGLFASGDWEGLSREMRGYKIGQVSYFMNLFCAAISWQALAFGCVGLTFKVSSLFSNVINMLGLSAPPILAVIFLNEKLTGLKVMAMLLAMWGFVSYMYQHYLEGLKMNKEEIGLTDNQQVALVDE